MKIYHSGKFCSTGSLMLASALLLGAAASDAHATQIANFTSSLTAASPTQLGRPVRNNTTPQDWAGDETYPGQNNTTTSFSYQRFSFNSTPFTGPFVEVGFLDTLGSNNLFISAYYNNYDNSTIASRANNWLGDTGFSIYILGNATFFDVVLPKNASLILVVNSTGPTGLNDPFQITVDDFTDTMYTDAPPVPEPSTIVTVGTGLLGLAGAARRRLAARA